MDPRMGLAMSLIDQIWYEICAVRKMWYAFFGMMIIMSLLLLYSFLAGDLSKETQIVAEMTGILLIICIIVSASILYKCSDIE